MSERRVIPIAKPVLDEREAAAARRVILSGWITQGPEVAAFEREFAEFVDAPYACAVSSCTTALHLALLAVGVKPGDEVITVSHSFIATANCIRYCGALPVFVDIEPASFNIDPKLIVESITPRTKAILAVHQVGMPCDLAALLDVARKHGLKLVEDAACAIGSEIRLNQGWQKIGKPHGDIACFSFHPRKIMSTGDGGMLTSSNPEYDRLFRLWRQHGMSVPDTVRHHSDEVIFESYPILGYNYRMTDIQAAIGREQLKRLPGIVARRRALAERYFEKLSGVPGFRLPFQPEWARSNWQSLLVYLPEEIDQKQVMQSMLDQGVSTRRAVMCIHREPSYRDQPWSCGGGQERCECSRQGCKRLRHGEYAQDHAIVLPLFHQMTEADQDRVVDALRHACLVRA